jgi:hypothetical protein
VFSTNIIDQIKVGETSNTHDMRQSLSLLITKPARKSIFHKFIGEWMDSLKVYRSEVERGYELRAVGDEQSNCIKR